MEYVSRHLWKRNVNILRSDIPFSILYTGKNPKVDTFCQGGYRETKVSLVARGSVN